MTNELREESFEQPSEGTLRLDHFLKTNALSETGGQAKMLIQDGLVKVNGQVETRRRRQLVVSDVVEIAGKKYVVKKTG